jgi:hypothetical protein
MMGSLLEESSLEVGFCNMVDDQRARRIQPGPIYSSLSAMMEALRKSCDYGGFITQPLISSANGKGDVTDAVTVYPPTSVKI